MTTTPTSAKLPERVGALRLADEADFTDNTLARLAENGIETIGDLFGHDPKNLCQLGLTGSELEDLGHFAQDVVRHYGQPAA